MTFPVAEHMVAPLCTLQQLGMEASCGAYVSTCPTAKYNVW